MAPVFSKMKPSHDALSTAANQRPPASLNQLSDDSLLVLLSFLPLVDFSSANQVALACKRLYSLLSQISRRRRTLYIVFPLAASNFFFIYHPHRRVSTSRYSAYLNALLDASKQDSLLQITSIYNEPFLLNTLSFPPSSLASIRAHFPHLTHLSLLLVDIEPGTLFHLLESLKNTLQSLALDPLFDASKTAERETLLAPLWPLLDSMPALVHLTLIRLANRVDLSAVLAALLPRLAAFHLTFYTGELIPLLEVCSETTLHQLTLKNTAVVPDEVFFGDLLERRPLLGKALTHLTLGRSLLQAHTSGVRSATVNYLVRALPRLTHLDLTLDATLRFNQICLYLSRLPFLVRLRLTSTSGTFFGTSTFHQSIVKVELKQLTVLTLSMDIHQEALKQVASFCPILRQLYLDECSTIVQRNGEAIGINRSADRFQEDGIIDALRGFPHLPKIKYKVSK